MFVRNICFFLFSLLTTKVCTKNAEDAADCFVSNKSYKCHLDAMTPYRFIANSNDDVLDYPDCSPKKLWILLRHGTRYPRKKWVTRMKNELPEITNSIVKSYNLGLGAISERDVKLLQNWLPSFSIEDAANLQSEGERELVGIAERFQSRFPSLMPEIYSNRTYRFKYTATQRAEESAKNFALGLFGRKQSRNVWYPIPESKDRILRFYKRCKRWRREIKENPESLREREKFLSSSAVQKMLNEVSERVGFVVDYESADLIHKICAYETAWNERKYSPWCSIFSVDDFKVIEFAHDLKYYWIDGYGQPLSYEQACTVTKDVFDFFDSADKTKTSAYFTHSGTILKLLSLLGIARDDIPLRHDAFTFDGKRNWRTSVIDAFASNVAFVLYDCTVQGPSILLMHQERVVNVAGCPLNKPCPLSTMKKKYPDVGAECPFEDMCATKK